MARTDTRIQTRETKSKRIDASWSYATHQPYSKVVASHAAGATTHSEPKPSDRDLGNKSELDGVGVLGEDRGGNADLG